MVNSNQKHGHDIKINNRNIKFDEGSFLFQMFVSKLLNSDGLVLDQTFRSRKFFYIFE
jgi:hypothetical protein